MRRPIVAIAVAALILAAATAGGSVLQACGGTTATTTQAAASGAPGGGQAPDMSGMFTTALDPLVKAGTITSAQEAAVVTALKASMPSGGQGGQPPGQGSLPSPGATPNGTPPSAAARPGGSGMFTAALDKLVSAGTITAAQETAIAKALSSGMQGGPGQGVATPTGSSSTTQTQ